MAGLVYSGVRGAGSTIPATLYFMYLLHTCIFKSLREMLVTATIQATLHVLRRRCGGQLPSCSPLPRRHPLPPRHHPLLPPQGEAVRQVQQEHTVIGGQGVSDQCKQTALIYVVIITTKFGNLIASIQ